MSGDLGRGPADRARSMERSVQHARDCAGGLHSGNVYLRGDRPNAGPPIRIGRSTPTAASPPVSRSPIGRRWRWRSTRSIRSGACWAESRSRVSRRQGQSGGSHQVRPELVVAEKVSLLAGTYLSHVGLAVSDFAKMRQVLFVAAEPLSEAITWSQGHRYTFRVRPNTTRRGGCWRNGPPGCRIESGR